MSTPSSLTVIAVDDHCLIRQGIRLQLMNQKDVKLVAEGSAGEEILPLVQKHQPDLLLVALGLPRQPGTSLRSADQRFPSSPPSTNSAAPIPPRT